MGNDLSRQKAFENLEKRLDSEYIDVLQEAIASAKPELIGGLSDGYHTFDELYEFRKMYNAALFNAWYSNRMYEVHKSKRHNGDPNPIFQDSENEWFIVIAFLPDGQISNHYTMDNWDLFHCEERIEAKWPFDGHSSQDVLDRLKALP